MVINKELRNKKRTLISYFRNRASEFLDDVNRTYATEEYKKKASKMNNKLRNSKEQLIQTVTQKAIKENWENNDILQCLLTITYTNYVVMLETRNSLRPYEYMDFSRRIGELWEPFCKLCFHYPNSEIELFIPPLFTEVKMNLHSEISLYIRSLNLSKSEKQNLISYYDKVWNLVTSGEIQLELDLHFISNGQKYVVDFKSGFGSNEKGNVNRLLLVASIYHTIPEKHKPVLLVRSNENNHYFETLKKSGVWDAYSGEETYKQVSNFTGFDLQTWITDNISWENDLDVTFVKYLHNNNLMQYLTW